MPKVDKRETINKMYHLWKEGKTVKEIAEEVKEPLDKVSACVNAFPEYEKMKKKKRTHK